MGLSPLWGGVAAATPTTWVTFVPCFIWIFLGAPYVEKVRANKALAGALAAITGAVVGVILNLAIWFGLHILFRQVGTQAWGPVRAPWPDLTTFDPAAALLCLVAAILVFVFKQGVVRTLLVCAVLGFGVKWLL